MFQPIDELCINTIRTLSIDAVQKANSGHPGMPLGAAPMAPPVPQNLARDSYGCDPRAQARQWCRGHEARPNHEPPATAWNGFVTTYAVTFGGRRRLI